MDRAPVDQPDRLVSLIRNGVLDTELAALVWLLVEANVPSIVAASTPSDAAEVRGALLDLRAPGTAVVVLAGEEESFGWMPEAAELGWHRDRQLSRESQERVARQRQPTVMVADLDSGDAGGGRSSATTWGERALVAIRALSVGYGMLATTRGARLEHVLSALAAQPVGAMDDELTRLGMVLILAPTGNGVSRVVAAHYLRPVSRDAEGHIHRFGPAVIATWDPGAARFEHFSWAITDELAGRTGVSTADFERGQQRRIELLRDLAGPTP